MPHMKIEDVKFMFSKKAIKFEPISHLILRLLSKCQIKWEIISNFCGLLECPHFTDYCYFYINLPCKATAVH